MSNLTQAISNLFNGNVPVATIIMSLIPLIELKGGIVYAVGEGLNFWQSFGLAYLGSTLVFIPIFFLLKPILNLLKKWKAFSGFASAIENYFQSKANETEQNQQGKSRIKDANRLKQLGVFLFVAIPLPMTGVWTGTAIAVFLGLSFRKTILPVVVGNLIAGLLVSAISALCVLIGIDLNIVLWCLFALAIIILAITIFKVAKHKPKNDGDNNN